VSTPDCSYEAEILEAITESRWPGACVAELHDHVDRCAFCRELVAVVLPLLEDHSALCRDARVPPAGAVWWRAQMRARREAAEAAIRPITVVERLALACAIGLTGGAATLMMPATRQWVSAMVEAVRRATLGGIELAQLQALAPAGILPLVAAWLLIAPIAIYLAVGEEK
jgi:hypothetical protein